MKNRHPYNSGRRLKADPQAMQRAFSRVKPFDQNETLQLTLPVRMAYDAMKSGTGVQDDFDTLAVIINLCLIRGEQIDPLCVETAKRGQDALMRCLERFNRLGKWGFDGPALDDVLSCVEFHEQLVHNSTPMQMRDAMLELRHRMEKGHTL